MLLLLLPFVLFVCWKAHLFQTKYQRQSALPFTRRVVSRELVHRLPVPKVPKKWLNQAADLCNHNVAIFHFRVASTDTAGLHYNQIGVSSTEKEDMGVKLGLPAR